MNKTIIFAPIMGPILIQLFKVISALRLFTYLSESSI